MATNGFELGFERKLWQAVDKMRNNIDDDKPFGAKMKRLTSGLSGQLKKSKELKGEIGEHLKGLEYEL
jgi:hypothetical protein